MRPTTTEEIILENQRAIMNALIAIGCHVNMGYDHRALLSLTYQSAKITGYIGPDKK